MRFIVYTQFIITILQWTLMRSIRGEHDYLFALWPSALICPLVCAAYRNDQTEKKKKREATNAMITSIYLSFMQIRSLEPFFY